MSEKVDFKRNDRVTAICKGLLTPCPFCRSEEDKLEIVSDGNVYCVSCSVCKASGPISKKSILASFLWVAAMDKDIQDPITNYSEIVDCMEVMIEVLGDE